MINPTENSGNSCFELEMRNVLFLFIETIGFRCPWFRSLMDSSLRNNKYSHKLRKWQRLTIVVTVEIKVK